MKPLVLQVFGSFLGAFLAIGVAFALRSEPDERLPEVVAPTQVSAIEEHSFAMGAGEQRSVSPHPSLLGSLQKGNVDMDGVQGFPTGLGAVDLQPGKAPSSANPTTFIPADPEMFLPSLPSKADATPTNFGDPYLSADDK